MNTECKQQEFEIQGFDARKIIVKNDGEKESSDGGLVLLSLLDKRYKITKQLAHCFTDLRNPKLIEHPLKRLLIQRIYGLCQGYEDINDHDTWRHDPLLAITCDTDPDKQCLAGKGTLNRLELGRTPQDQKDRYKNIRYDLKKMQELLIDLYIDTAVGPRGKLNEIIIDVDSTDDPIHGNQEGRFFHGYYDEYCYLPLYLFINDFPVWVELRTADTDPADGVIPALSKIVKRIRDKWPWVHIILRGDSGFNRPTILSWCEQQFRVSYIIGMPKNKRLLKIVGKDLHTVQQDCLKSGEAHRLYSEFMYQTKKSWERPRRVIAKAEHLPGRSNPRFIVTNLGERITSPQQAYEVLYCARGNMENRIKEQKLFLFADRLSSHTIRANQLRLFFSTFAYIFMMLIRRTCYDDTAFSVAQSSSIRVKLLKVAARITATTRRIVIHIPTAFPYWETWFRLQYRFQI